MPDKTRHHETLLFRNLRVLAQPVTFSFSFPVSGTRKTVVIPKYTTPYNPRQAIASVIGWRQCIISLGPQPAAAAITAAIHNLPMNETERPVLPTRVFSAFRRSANSNHPASPADAVRPTTPHRGLRPKKYGRRKADTYPSTAVKRTRKTAKRR